MDLKYREVPHKVWKPLVMFNLPVWLYFVATGVYEGWMLGISVVAMCVFFAMMRAHLIEGADFVYMSLIAFFLVMSPRTGIAGLAACFTIFLVALTVASTIVVKTVNAINGENVLRAEMFPMMLPISAALIFTVMLV
jgi:hypothetical protein